MVFPPRACRAVTHLDPPPAGASDDGLRDLSFRASCAGGRLEEPAPPPPSDWLERPGLSRSDRRSQQSDSASNAIRSDKPNVYLASLLARAIARLRKTVSVSVNHASKLGVVNLPDLRHASDSTFR